MKHLATHAIHLKTFDCLRAEHISWELPGTCDGETGPPENVETDDDKNSLNSDEYRNIDSKSCIYKSTPTDNKLGIITMFKLARSS